MSRVVHLTSAHPRDDIRIFLKECRSLSAHGYEVLFVVADGCGNKVSKGVMILDTGLPIGRVGRMIKVTQRVFA